MFTNHPRRSFLSLAVLLTFLFGALTVSAATSSAVGAVRANDPASLVRSSDLDQATKATLLQLIDEADASTGDREQFLTATESIAQVLVDAEASSEFVDEFADSYESSYSLQTEFEWEIKPSVGKCNAKFECSLALGVCVVITWHDDNGSGGINCISQSVQ